MIIYIVSINEEIRDKLKEHRKDLNMLFSFFYKSEAIRILEGHDESKKSPKLFLDSGAYSAMTQNKVITIEEYASFIKKNKSKLTAYANLDVIGDAKATWKNQKALERLDLNPVPVFHYGDDAKHLQKYLNKGYKYIALGGLVKAPNQQQWLDQIWSKYLTNKKGEAIIKIHGFGLTTHSLMLRYPWHSVDSTTWAMAAAMGEVILPGSNDNYLKPPWRIGVSTLHPGMLKRNQHVSTLSENIQKGFNRYINKYEIKLGKSLICYVDADYQLQKGESWIKENETALLVHKYGLCNDYVERRKMNILFYLGMQRELKKHTIRFKHNVTKKFF